jgi:hypothetical protein
MIAISVIFMVIIIIIIYIIVRVLWRKQYSGTLRKADQSYEIKSSDLESSSGTEFTYSIWIYIDNWNEGYGKKKVIFTHGGFFELYLGEYRNEIIAKSALQYKTTDIPSDGSTDDMYTWQYFSFNKLSNPSDFTTTGTQTNASNPSDAKNTCTSICSKNTNCSLYSYNGSQCNYYSSSSKGDIATIPGNDNDFVAQKMLGPDDPYVVSTDPSPDSSSGANSASTVGTIDSDNGKYNICTVPNIPTQKWVNVAVSISSVSVDIYIDGKLTKTCVLSSQIASTVDANVILSPNGKGFNGWNARFEYWAKYMTPQEIWKVYKNGYQQTFNFGNYKLSVGIYKGDVEKASFTI